MEKKISLSTTPEESIRDAARHFGVSEEDVYQEIERSIRMAYLTGSEEALAKLNAVPCEGDIPTPQELIAHLLQKLRQENEN